jgi:hypothetical protein
VVVPVAGAVVVTVDEVVVLVVPEVLLEPPLSPPPQPTAKSIAAAPPSSAIPVLACDFINASLLSRPTLRIPRTRDAKRGTARGGFSRRR